MKAKALLGALALFFGTTIQAAEFLNPPGDAALGLPFSDAVRVGNLLILSGKLGNKPGTMELVPGGIKAEAKQTMENSGCRWNGTAPVCRIKCVMMADIDEWAAFNEIYVTYFSGPKPARSAFAASGLGTVGWKWSAGRNYMNSSAIDG